MLRKVGADAPDRKAANTHTACENSTHLDAGQHLLCAVPPRHNNDIKAAKALCVRSYAVQQRAVVNSACISTPTSLPHAHGAALAQRVRQRAALNKSGLACAGAPTYGLPRDAAVMLASRCLAQLAFASMNDIRAVVGYRCLSCATHGSSFSRCALSCAWPHVKTSSQPKASSSLCAAALCSFFPERRTADTERVTVRDSFSAAAHVRAQPADLQVMQGMGACAATFHTGPRQMDQKLRMRIGKRCTKHAPAGVKRAV